MMRNNLNSFVLGGVLLLVGLVACSESAEGDWETDHDDFDFVMSGEPRDMSPQPSEGDLASLTTGNTAFAFDLYAALTQDNQDNLFYSPFSISMALAMNYGGARGETEQQMADSLHFLLDQPKLHQAFNKVDLELSSRENPSSDADQGFKLVLANSLWAQQGFAFLDDYLDLLSINYGAGLRLLDFAGAPVESGQIINQWISEKTDGQIPSLLAPDDIDESVLTVLVNAISFKAPWNLPFEENATETASFTTLAGETVSVQMMKQNEHFSYTEGDDYQAVGLRYDGEKLDMVVILPREGDFSAFENGLTGARIETILGEMHSPSSTWVTLSMPRFAFSSRLPLHDTLPELGMIDAFGDNANFSGMSDTFLRIKKVIHQATVSVNEAGTEAGASTVIIDSNGDADYAKVTMDRPFIFVIRDRPTGTILFVGRVTNPQV